MADEISFQGSISVNATNFTEVISPGQVSIDLPSGPDLASEGGTQATSNTMSSLQVGNLGSSQDGGVFFFRNLDSTNNIEIGEDLSGFKPWLLLKPGEYAMGRLSSRYPSTALKVKSSAGTPVLQYRIFAGDL
jgi:hypothetical protein